jgi:hypothetical protein
MNALLVRICICHKKNAVEFKAEAQVGRRELSCTCTK